MWQSLIKTTVMMIGEFEYVGIFFDGTVHFDVLGYLMFCVFLIVMSIIIMNLLVSFFSFLFSSLEPGLSSFTLPSLV